MPQGKGHTINKQKKRCLEPILRGEARRTAQYRTTEVRGPGLI